LLGKCFQPEEEEEERGEGEGEEEKDPYGGEDNTVNKKKGPADKVDYCSLKLAISWKHG
jgi:hypothetical protein